MKKLLLLLAICCSFQITSAQRALQIDGEVVFENEDVTFHKIDDHTWIGSGHVMANESIYVIEGTERALLIDAATNIKDLDKIVIKITNKPVTLVATHAHPDHVGSAQYFPEIF
jgi:glyoxylase-like metal-dependent hydrolase (beta-lactamase superfamily II)